MNFYIACKLMDFGNNTGYLPSMVQTYDTFWQKIFAKRLGEAASRESERIVTGNAEDFADYKYQAGIIRGLNIAHDLIDDVNSEINKAEQGSK
jgi:hypothetical protein